MRYTALLLALGLTGFSMHPVPCSKYATRSASATASSCAPSAHACCVRRRAGIERVLADAKG